MSLLDRFIAKIRTLTFETVGRSELKHRRTAAGDSVCFWFPIWPVVGISICLTLSIHYSTVQWIIRPVVSGCRGGESGISLHSFALFWLMCDNKHLPSFFFLISPQIWITNSFNTVVLPRGAMLLAGTFIVQTVRSTKEKYFPKLHLQHLHFGIRFFLTANFKEVVHSKCFSSLLTLMLLQTCMTVFLLWNTKYILKTVGFQRQLDHADLFYGQKYTETLFKISSTGLDWHEGLTVNDYNF